MSMAFAEEVGHARDLGHLSEGDIARATGAAPSTVRAWLNATRRPTGVRADRIAELSALVERLARVIDAEYIPVWLHKPVPALDDDKPLDVLARGDYRAVSRLVAALESPVAS
jgi:transcriptional regulator with XRE-family HTH domain